MKLPKIDLPTYPGKYTDWCTFWDTFDSTVHQNSTLSDVERFHYLTASLSGSPAAAIRGLRVTNDNYAEAVSILKERFGDKNRIISAHLEDLMKLPDVSEKEDNIVAMRRFCDELESHSRSLGCLGVEPDTYGTMLAPVVMGKLPQSWSLLISRNVGDGWELKSIVRELRKEVALRERTESRVMKTGRASRTNNRAPARTAATLTSSAGRDSQCCFCNRTGHESAWCSVITREKKRPLETIRSVFRLPEKRARGQKMHRQAMSELWRKAVCFVLFCFVLFCFVLFVGRLLKASVCATDPLDSRPLRVAK